MSGLLVVVAAIALVSFVLGVVLAYSLQSHREEPDPPLRVGPLGVATLRLSGDCELGPGLCNVEPGGVLTIQITDDVPLAPGTHDLTGATFRGAP